MKDTNKDEETSGETEKPSRPKRFAHFFDRFDTQESDSSDSNTPESENGTEDTSSTSLTEEEPVEYIRRLISEGRDPISGETITSKFGVEPRNMTHPREFYALWAIALLTFGVGDVVTTGVGVLFVPEIIERNPIVDLTLQTGGIPGFVLLKTIIFVILFKISLDAADGDDLFDYYWPPTTAILLGTALSVWNLLNLFIL